MATISGKWKFNKNATLPGGYGNTWGPYKFYGKFGDTDYSDGVNIYFQIADGNGDNLYLKVENEPYITYWCDGECVKNNYSILSCDEEIGVIDFGETPQEMDDDLYEALMHIIKPNGTPNSKIVDIDELEDDLIKVADAIRESTGISRELDFPEDYISSLTHLIDKPTELSFRTPTNGFIDFRGTIMYADVQDLTSGREISVKSASVTGFKLYELQISLDKDMNEYGGKTIKLQLQTATGTRIVTIYDNILLIPDTPQVVMGIDGLIVDRKDSEVLLKSGAYIEYLPTTIPESFAKLSASIGLEDSSIVLHNDLSAATLNSGVTGGKISEINIPASSPVNLKIKYSMYAESTQGEFTMSNSSMVENGIRYIEKFFLTSDVYVGHLLKKRLEAGIQAEVII